MVDLVARRGEEIYANTIKKKGYFDYEELYFFCFVWFKEMGYTLLENSYIEKVSDFGKEILLEWVASRKVNDYFKYVIKSSWQILGLNPAEIEVGGKKIETNKGELKMKVKGSLVRDYGGRWKKKSLFGPLRNMYEGYVIRKNIDEYEERAYEEVDQFVNELKEHLGLEGKE